MIILATGMQELDKELSEAFPDSQECYYQEAVFEMARDKKADIVIVSPRLPGPPDQLVDIVIEPLRLSNVRVILLPGPAELRKTKELVQEVISLGVYDIIFDPVTSEKVIDCVHNPRSLADVAHLIVAESRRKSGKGLLERLVSKLAPQTPTEERKHLLAKLAQRDKSVISSGKNNSYISYDAVEIPEHFTVQGNYREPYSPSDTERPRKETTLSQLPPDFEVLGSIPGARCYSTIQELIYANPTAIVIQADRRDLVETIKSLRRDSRLAAVPVVVLGDCDTAHCYNAGADECVTDLNTETVERIRARAARMRKLWAQAERDPLTGLYNRRFLEKYLAEQERRYRETGVPFSLMMADLDHFKAVNDTYSHDAGDAVLREFASFLTGGVRQTDVTVRYGGEEFIVVFPGTGDARGIAWRLCRGWAGHRIKLPGGQVIQSTFSGGLAVIGRDGRDAEALIRAADRSMYLAKQAGRNRVVAAGDRVEVVEKTAVQQSIASRQGQPAASLPKPGGMPETALSRPVLPVKRKEKIYLKLPTWRPEIPKPNVSRILSKIAPASKEDIPNLVAVWSPAPTGKTFTAVNLAAAYALKGYRTVLVSRDAISHSGEVHGLTVLDKGEYRRLAEEFEVVVVDGYRDALRCAGQIMLVVNVTYLDAITEILDRVELDWNKVWVVANGVPDEEIGRVEAALQLKVDYVVPYTEGRPATTLLGPGLAEVFRSAAVI